MADKTVQNTLSLTKYFQIKEDEENYDLCMQYATYNLKYHKCLDPDSHSIKRTLEGLYDKFVVHCQDEKKDILKKKIQQFLDIPQFEHKEHGTTETHWAVISLLLALSDSPTNTTYQERKKKTKKDQRDDFDWTAYLLEGEEIYIHPDYESPELSEDEECDTRSASPHIKFKWTNEIPHESHMTKSEKVDVSIMQAESDEAWLQRNLIVQYWKGGSIPMEISHRSSNLTHDWESHMSSSNEIYVPAQKTFVTEYQVVRETLWVLSGASDSCVYTISDGCCSVSTHIKVCHLTENSLHNILSVFAKYATVLLQLQQFVETVTSLNMFEEQPTEGVFINCQTYQAFAYCIGKYLTEFKKMLVILEKSTAQQVEPASISWLQNHMAQFFGEIDLLDHILANGVRAVSHVTSIPERSSHLLTVIYNTLLSCDTMGENNLVEVSLLLPLWVETCKPYLDVIDNWIYNGILLDPRKEFIIQRNESVQCLNETFWDTAFTLHCTQTTPPSSSSSQTNSEAGSETEGSSGDGSGQTTPHAPYFLLPVLREIVLAGKSMEMLESLGRKSEFVQNRDTGSEKRRTLYETFVKSMEEFLGTFENEETGKDIDNFTNKSRSRKHDIFKENVRQQMQVKEVKDPLLRLNFERIFIAQEFKTQSLTEKADKIERQLKSLRLGGMAGLSPIHLVVEECLYPHVRQRYIVVCTGLLTILKEKFLLMNYLGAMRKFYLMEVGDTMYDFYTEIFNKLRHGEAWQDVSYLTMLLQEALQTHYPEQIERLSICIRGSESKTKTKQPVTALEGLTLQYKVPWPVDVVLNTKAIAVYNQVFAFLLQIKRAKFCLDELRFSDLEKEAILAKSAADESFLDVGPVTTRLPRKQLLHQMHILRANFMTFVNSLHQYVMTRILHSTGLEFQADIEKATDLDQLISVHRKYLAAIHERCLQHPGVHMIRDIVMKVLNMAIQFQKTWDNGVDHLSDRIVKEMEVEFSRCMLFLASVLNNAIKRGSFPHLESLAFSLITFLDQKS